MKSGTVFAVGSLRLVSAGFLTGALLLSTPSPAQTATPIPGSPPLTVEMVQKASKFMEWLLDAPLTVEERNQFRDSVVQSWKSGNQEEIRSMLSVIQFTDQLSTKAPRDQELYRQALQSKVIAEVRAQPPSNLSRWVLNIYDSAHKPLAPGNPPLTRQTVDAYAEMMSFMLEQAMGSKVYTADRAFKDALAQMLTARYSQFDAQQRVSMAQIPLEWASMQAKWPQLSVVEQQNLRLQWRSSLLPAQTAAANANSSSEQQLSNQVQKSAANAFSNQSYVSGTSSIIMNRITSGFH
jgi:hypothetical protein